MRRNKNCRVDDPCPWIELDGVIREFCVLEKSFEFGEIPGDEIAVRINGGLKGNRRLGFGFSGNLRWSIISALKINWVYGG
jgi:hypothetical protein